MASQKGKTKRIVGGTVLVLFLAGMGYAGAWVGSRRVAPPPVALADVQAALDQPVDTPGAALPVVDRGVVTVVDGLARAEVTVPPWQCVLALVGGATPKPFASVGLFETESRQSRVYARRERMVSLGWCATDAPLALTLWGTTPELSGQDLTDAGEGAMAYRFHVGPPEGDWRGYVVGVPADDETLSTLTAAWTAHVGEQRDIERAPAGEPIVRLDVGPEEALALPLSPSTRSVAAALPTAGRSEPAYDPRLKAASGGSQGTERPLALIDDSYHRLLAVVDPSDLPIEEAVPCVTVHLSRLGIAPGRSAWLTVPGLEATAGAEHRLCPGDPLTAFVADPDDGADWRIRLLRAEGASAPRSATAPPTEPLVGPTFRQALERCESGDAASCAEASRYLAAGRYVAPDPERARRLGDRACRAEAQYCGAYGSFLRDRGDAEGAFEAWSRGCHIGNDGMACATLGEAYRLGDGHPFDAVSAQQAYRKACTLGVERACERMRTMELLELG